jgi:hypothetical protein
MRGFFIGVALGVAIRTPHYEFARRDLHELHIDGVLAGSRVFRLAQRQKRKASQNHRGWNEAPE